MYETDQNKEIITEIIDILAQNQCTVAEAKQILRYISSTITTKAPVQKIDNVFGEY